MAASPGAGAVAAAFARSAARGDGSARQGQVSAGLCSGRAPPGNGEGGDSGVDCTAAHCSTPGTKICWANGAGVAAVC